ncbi:hypothetical protein [Actinoplanes sp. NPDC049681]|uniref:hypothetical protein n=1 Tax=Actinoplanes sp. NPDC049681 TaxID=3363905 RepID=UPI0037A5D1CA
MVADWALLLVLAALSWCFPRWRRPLAITAGVLGILLVMVMLGSGTAIAHSLVAGQDLPEDAFPYDAAIDYLGGSWLGLVGAVALVAAVVLPDLPKRDAAKRSTLSDSGPWSNRGHGWWSGVRSRRPRTRSGTSSGWTGSSIA